MNLPSQSVSIYKQVMDRKQAIVAEIALLGCKQAVLKEQLADIEGFLRTFGRIVPDGEFSSDANNQSAGLKIQQGEKPTKQDIVAQAVREILGHGDVLSTNQILDQLARRGISIGGRNPSGNLASMLSKATGIVSSRAAKGWILVSVVEGEP